jgi:hypothetical protein
MDWDQEINDGLFINHLPSGVDIEPLPSSGGFHFFHI